MADVTYFKMEIDGVNYGYSPISEILALPEREVEDGISDNE